MANSNPPQAGQWFYIQSNLTDSIGRAFVANVEAANISAGAQIILWPLQPNAYNVLWEYDNGYIISRLKNSSISFLVLDLSVSPTNSVVLNLPNGSSSQQWTFYDDGTIRNQSNGLVLDITGGAAQSGSGLVVDSLTQGQASDAQKWSVVFPQLFVPKWTYIQSGLTENQNNPLVATIQEGESNVVLSPLQLGSSNQLWQITPDGRILSATSGNPVMTLGSQLGGGQNGNYLVTAPSPVQTDSTLQWTFNDQNMFINASNGLALNVEGSSVNQNTPLITYAVQSGPPNNEVWSIIPASTLTDIMAAPPVPFPPFPGDEATAYADINNKIGNQPYIPNFNLRSQYTNLGAPLSDWLSTVQDMPIGQCPSGVDPTDWQSDWQSVVNQLTAELTAADSIQKLFVQYNLFHGNVFTDQSTTLTKLIGDANLDQGGTKPNVVGTILAVLEGVLYTALEAVPGVGQVVTVCAVLGNVMAAGINIGMNAASMGGGSISPNPFQVTVSELEGQLSSNFEALFTAIGNMEETILADWGKMQATYYAILSTGPNSLAWPSNLTASLESAAIRGYTIAAMQMLLPSKYQILQYQNQKDNDWLSDPPQSVQWIQPTGNNTWNKYWIATPGDWTEYPSDQALEDVWNAGVAKSDFFQGLAGWGFAQGYVVATESPFNPCDYLVTTITNRTPNPLTVTASPSSGKVIGSTSQTLQPYGSVAFLGFYQMGLAIDIAIYDPNLAGSDQVAWFTAHQHSCSSAAGDVWIDPALASLGYQLTASTCNRGSLSYGYSGAAQIGICLAPINLTS